VCSCNAFLLVGVVFLAVLGFLISCKFLPNAYCEYKERNSRAMKLKSFKSKY